MPKRTRQQQDRHNERRRMIKQEGRKSIFCMEYIKRKYPKIHQEVCKIYTYVNHTYPGKRDLTKTPEFNNCLKGQLAENITTTTLEPVLQISLIPSQTISTTTTTIEEMPPVIPSHQAVSTTITTTTEEIPPVITTDESPLVATDFETQEIRKIIDELRQDPDLATVFDDIQLPDDFQMDFQSLGQDLPELIDQEIDWF